MKTKIIFTILTILLCCTLTNAQPGALDPTFEPGTGVNGSVATTLIQSDGKIIIGGIFNSYNGTPRNRIARLNTDGSLDHSFDPGMGEIGYKWVWTSSLQSDGKIIIGGDFTEFNGTPRNHIARLNVDGSLDTSFDPGTGAVGYGIKTTSIQNDGKIIIGGSIWEYNGTAINNFARLNTDGSLDTSFDTGTGFIGGPISISIQSDGKIIIGGSFTSYNGTPRNRIARLNTDGSIDTSFDPGTGVNIWGVNTTSLQSDGKIIIGGDFTEYNGTEINHIARLNTDGSLDTSFNPGTGAEGAIIYSVGNISLQSDGKIIIGGSFTSYNGTPIKHIARLNTDGSLDTSFNQGTGPNLDVYTTSIQSDGKIIIGGIFKEYNGTPINSIARLYDCYFSTSSQSETACGSYSWKGTTYTISGTYVDIIPNSVGCDSIISLNLTIDTVDVSVSQSGTQLIAGAASAKYQWLDCDNAYAVLPGDTNQAFMATVNGNYAVAVIENNCTDTSSCYAVNNVNIQTPVAGLSLQLFPNPNSGTFNIFWDKPTGFTRITIYNILGQIVYDQSLAQKEYYQIKLDVPSGLYNIRLSQDNQIIMSDNLVITD